MESSKQKETTVTDEIVTFRLSAKDQDIVRYLRGASNRSAEIKRIIRAYINFIGDGNEQTDKR